MRELTSNTLRLLQSSPILIDRWTSTPLPDKRRNTWQLYRENEVKKVIQTVKSGNNVVVIGGEQAGKSSSLVETYYELTAQESPVFGFSTRSILAELPKQEKGENLTQISNKLLSLPDESIVILDNVDYMFRDYLSMKLHPVDGKHYLQPELENFFMENCRDLFKLLTNKNFKFIFSLHNDWPDSWVNPELKQMWNKILGKQFDYVELSPFLEPAKAEEFLKFERGISLDKVPDNKRNLILSSISFHDLKHISSEELQLLLK